MSSINSGRRWVRGGPLGTNRHYEGARRFPKRGDTRRVEISVPIAVSEYYGPTGSMMPRSPWKGQGSVRSGEDQGVGGLGGFEVAKALVLVATNAGGLSRMRTPADPVIGGNAVRPERRSVAYRAGQRAFLGIVPISSNCWMLPSDAWNSSISPPRVKRSVTTLPPPSV